MTIYRLESTDVNNNMHDINGNPIYYGPYRHPSSVTIDDEFYSSLGNYLTPVIDRNSHPTPTDLGYYELYGNYICAFESMNALHTWFEDSKAVIEVMELGLLNVVTYQEAIEPVILGDRCDIIKHHTQLFIIPSILANRTIINNEYINYVGGITSALN